jgi:hypothetical protein
MIVRCLPVVKVQAVGSDAIKRILIGNWIIDRNNVPQLKAAVRGDDDASAFFGEAGMGEGGGGDGCGSGGRGDGAVMGNIQAGADKGRFGCVLG